jgi:hypothetical protein
VEASAQTGTLHALARHLVLAMRPLTEAVADLPAFRTLLYRLGWDVKSLPPEYTALAAKVDAALVALDGLGDSPQPAEVLDLLDQAKAIHQAISGLRTAPDGVDPADFLAEIGQRLFELLLVDYLTSELPGVYSLLLSLGIVTQENVHETPGRPGFLRSRVHWDQVPAVLTDPGSIPERIYGWGTDDLDFHRLSGDLLGLFLALGWPAHIGPLDPGRGHGFMERPEDILIGGEWELRVPVLLDTVGGKEIELGLALLELPGQDDQPAGLVLQPLVPPEVGTGFAISDTLRLELRAGSDVAKAFGVVLRPGKATVRFPFDRGAALPAAGFGATLRHLPAGPELLLGDPSGTRLTMQGAAASLELDTGQDGLEVTAGLEVQALTLVLAAQDEDGFLGDVVGDREASFALPLRVRWSSRTGLSLAAGGGLALTETTARRLGPVTVQALHLAVRGSTEPDRPPGLVVEAGASLGAGIGPVSASVANTGLRLTVTFTDGNAGPFDVDVGFMAPSGIGLAIDAHAVTGGGFLFHDPVQGSYAGVMQLSLRDELTLTAYGIIATRLPDGGRGYSLLIFITAEGFEPVPLGLGFQLEAIGGLLGVHRTFDQEVLTAGLKSDTLATLLFPRDPVANAPALIQALAAAFPPRQGSYLLGLMARITWFTPTLVTLDLALVLELGARSRLLALGRVSALLPSADNDLIRLNLDAVGVLDLDAGTLACDAVLVDSRLVHQFPITGSAALRAAWPGGGGSLTTGGFVLAVGGLNPRFAAPAAFPPLERVAIALCSGDNPRLVCDAYLAVTPNTVQFGARTSLYASALGFSVAGDLGFDALVELLPPHFIVDFHASVQLKRGSTNLFKVTLDGTLEGPLPLRLSAKASFELLWMSFSVHFDFTLSPGDLVEAALPAVDLAAELARALADPGSWSSRRPPGLGHGVALRALPPGPALVLDPLGQLLVRQQVAPLNAARDVDTYGGNPVAGPRRFQLAATLQGAAAATVPGAFAPARYFTMSDDEKLAAPSFEAMDAGLVLGDGGASFDPATVVAAPLAYESIVLGPAGAPGSAPAGRGRYELPAGALAAQGGTGAAARAPARRVGAARFRNAAGRPAVTLAAPRWRLVHASDGAVAPEDPALTTWSEHRAALATLNRGGARWLLVPAHELQPSP